MSKDNFPRNMIVFICIADTMPEKPKAISPYFKNILLKILFR